MDSPACLYTANAVHGAARTLDMHLTESKATEEVKMVGDSLHAAQVAAQHISRPLQLEGSLHCLVAGRAF